MGISDAKVTLELSNNSPNDIYLFAGHSYGRNTNIPPTRLQIPWPKPGKSFK